MVSLDPGKECMSHKYNITVVPESKGIIKKLWDIVTMTHELEIEGSSPRQI